jgi:hypothetical protein
MKKAVLFYFAFTLLAVTGMSQILYQSSFEQYNVGDYLAVVDPSWTTWSNQPGGSEDGVISGDYASAGTKSVKISGLNDAVFPISNYTTGLYKIIFKMYVPSGYYGYFNILQLFAGGSSQWGMQVFFDTGGQGSIDGGAQAAATFTYPYDTWMLIENVIDLDTDWADFYIDGVLIHGWIWSSGTFGTGTLNQLGGVDMYAWAENGTPLYYFDEFTFQSGLGGFDLDLKAFLEGPFNVTQMEAWLNSNNFIPLAQPYNVAPWNYAGTESVAAMPNANVVDWVLVELRDATSAATATSATMVGRQAAFILQDGTIRGIDGTSLLSFNLTIANQLYVVIWHRNHLGVISSNALVIAGNTYTYDFTTGSGQAYGGANGHKEIGTGIWGMVSGDGNADGQINNTDKNDVWKVESGNAGYKAGDFNMDGQVSNPDKIEKWKPNSGRSCQVPI